MNKKKTLDCVEIKQTVQGKIYQEIKDMTPVEEMAYFRKKVETGPFADKWKAAQERQTRKMKNAS